MSENPASSPFDVEHEVDTPEAPAAARPTRKPAERRSLRRRRGKEAPPGEGGSGSGFGRFVAGFFAGPRWFLALSLVLTGGALCAYFNPDFGLRAKAWVWTVLQGDGLGGADVWSTATVEAGALCLLVLALLVAVFRGSGRARGRWIAPWLVLGLVVFQPTRGAFLLLLPIVTAVGIGLLVRRRNASRFELGLVLLILAGFLLLPPQGAAAGDEACCEAAAAVERIGAIGDDGAPGLWEVLGGDLPVHAGMIAFVLLLLALLGVRGRWAGYVGGGLLLVLLFGHAAHVHASAPAGAEGDPSWWSAARATAELLGGGLFALLPAVVASTAELGEEA